MNDETADNFAGGIADSSKGDALNWFIRSAAIILLITGIAKVWTAFGNVKLLTVADPIVGIPFQHLMLAIGAGEIVIALVCFFRKRRTLALGLVAWMSTNFVAYRLGLWWVDWRKPCNCLGNLTDALHISPQLADNIMKVVLAYLLIGSYALLVWEWRKSRGRRTEGGGQIPESGGPEHALPIADGK